MTSTDDPVWVVVLTRDGSLPVPTDDAELAFEGDVEHQLLGSGDPWKRVAVLRCGGTEQDRYAHVDGASTTVLGCRPATGDLAVPDVGELADWDTVPHPPTGDDGPVMVIHVTRYAEAGGREAMARYQAAAALTAVPHGVRVAGWFDVHGMLAGDGREWDQVRFNRFPSKAAFFAVAADPARLEAQAAHREPALADTYTLVVRPTVDVLGEVR